MKALILFLISLWTGNSFAQTSVEKNEGGITIVKLYLDDYVCSESQWVYLHGYKDWVSGNECTIFDSVFVAQGEHVVQLQTYIPEAQAVNILFEKQGPLNMQLAIEPNSSLGITVCEEDGDVSIFKRAEQGGSLNNRLHDFLEERSEYLRRIGTLHQEKEAEEAQRLERNTFEKRCTMLLNADVAEEAYEMAVCLKIDFRSYSEEVGDILEQIALKFPTSGLIQEYMHKKKGLPATAEARKCSLRIQELRKKRKDILFYLQKIGDELILSFPDAMGNELTTDHRAEDFVLIDFWASWCVPCRKEMPDIKKVQEQYGKRLLVYAISLDADRKAWQAAIDKDGTGNFVHVIGTYPNGQPTQNMKRMRVHSIPKNLLLDKNQRIIAKDLHGDELMQLLDSLMNQ